VNFQSVPSGGSNGFAGISGDALALNDAGQIAFNATLTGSGIDSTNRRGIWATDRTGALQLIARSGNTLEVAPGDFRTIRQDDNLGSSLRFLIGSGNSDGHPSAFNNRGQLVFWARFTDGTAGIFVSNRVAIPEPSTFLLAATAGAALRYGRKAAQRR
jgi:hypothetical protein